MHLQPWGPEGAFQYTPSVSVHMCVGAQSTAVGMDEPFPRGDSREEEPREREGWMGSLMIPSAPKLNKTISLDSWDVSVTSKFATSEARRFSIPLSKSSWKPVSPTASKLAGCFALPPWPVLSSTVHECPSHCRRTALPCYCCSCLLPTCCSRVLCYHLRPAPCVKGIRSCWQASCMGSALGGS